jgi:hypothetical protein
MGMAFTDALIDHADDRRHAAGGHWQDAYPFVQLYQASLFYGSGRRSWGPSPSSMRGRQRVAGRVARIRKMVSVSNADKCI